MRRNEPNARKLVLIVDQNDDVRNLYVQYLQLFDFETEQAADGREALAKAISRDPTVIVTDTCLPGIDGCQLCEVAA